MKLANLVIVFCFALMACADVSSETESEFVPATGLVDAIANAQCDRIFVCCEKDELNIVLSGLETIDKAACVRTLKKQLSAFFGPSIEAAQKKNRISLDATKIDACGEAIRDQTCENISDDGTQLQRFQACRLAVIAEQETTGFCDNDYECKSEFCVSDDSVGSCKTIPNIGDPCESLRCAKDQFCNENEICSSLGTGGDPCLNNASCESGKCSLQTNTCQARAGLCND